MRDDLRDVRLHASPHLGVAHAVLGGVGRHGVSDDGVLQEGGLGLAALLELEAGEAGAELVEGAAGAAAQPPPHATTPPSFFNWA